jgi:hypothetical protein
MVAIRAGAREVPVLKAADVRFGSKADLCSAKRHVRFTPESGHPKVTAPTIGGTITAPRPAEQSQRGHATLRQL